MQFIKRYLKAVSALVVQLFAMCLTWFLTGTYSEAELVQTLTALFSALIVALVSNTDTPPSLDAGTLYPKGEPPR